MKFELAALALANLAVCQPAPQNTVAPTPEPVEDAHAVDGNTKGSSMCRTIDNDECNLAIEYFKDHQRYTEHTEITIGYNHGNFFGMPVYITGCKAEWYCENQEDYNNGMTGQGIKDAFQWLADEKGRKQCGSAQLSNSCKVKVNYCHDTGCDWIYDIVNQDKTKPHGPFPCNNEKAGRGCN